MPRRRKELTAEEKARVKQRTRSLQSRERRQRRKPSSSEATDITWLIRDGIRAAAAKIMNHSYSHPAPYWLSIPTDVIKTQGADFYPCRSVRKGDRTWFGFLFREHRDRQVELWPDSRKELTPTQQ